MEDRGAGRTKRVLSYCQLALTLLAVAFTVIRWWGLGRIEATWVVVLGAAIYGLFVLYCLVDILWWRRYTLVWVIGVAAILVASYWCLSFLSSRAAPTFYLLPDAWHPDPWGYVALGAVLCVYCLWDVIDAYWNEYRDERLLYQASGFMLTAIIMWTVLSFLPHEAVVV